VAGQLIDAGAIIAEARRARAFGAQIVVVGLHWGREYEHRPSPAQVTLAHQLLPGGDLDANPGQPQPRRATVRADQRRWVVYGMGNGIARRADGDADRHEGGCPG
jgi:poly-gamma-glutamate capsule biosynthesis protein CapA/YwtB (metallophosphatase superfamily)